MEGVWQKAVNHSEKKDLNDELLKFLQSADPEALKFEELVTRLERLLDEKSDNTTIAEFPEPSSEISSEPASEPIEMEKVKHDSNFLQSQWNNLGNNLDWQAIKNALVQRVDLSDVDLEDVWHTLQSWYRQIDPERNSPLAFNTIKNDVEDYLDRVPPWYLNCEKGWQEFKTVIYDPQAATVEVRAQLEQVQPQDFVRLLQQRNDLDPAKIESIVERLKTVREDVLSQIEATELQEQQQQLTQLLENHVRTVELKKLQNKDFVTEIEQLLIESGVTTETLIQLLQSWKQLDIQAWMEQRADLEPKERQQIVGQLEPIGDRLIKKISDRQTTANSIAEELQHKLESYFRYTKTKHLTSERIATKLEQLWQEAKDNLLSREQLPEIDEKKCFWLRNILHSRIDSSVLREILQRRKGLDAERAEEIATQIATWQQATETSTLKDSHLQEKSTELAENIVNYLYDAIAKNANVTEIEAGLPQLLEQAKSKTTNQIERQLYRLDWHGIEQKLKELPQNSTQQIGQTAKHLRTSIRKLAKLPRRWATRTSDRVKDISAEIRDFFSYGNKNDFTSQNLERNLKDILHSLKLESATENNLDRLEELNSATIDRSLAARKDITSQEIAEISDRFTTITKEITEEVKAKQEQTNQSMQQLSEQIGEYFGSLDLWQNQLDDFHFSTLVDSWREKVAEIPLEQLGDRLGQLSYETLAKAIETNKSLHNSTLEQVRGIQDYITQQIEDIKTSAYQQTETLKQQALDRVEATRGAIASATYWLFAITFTSAVTSALAGFLATTVSF